MNKSKILYLIFLVFAQIIIGLIWWWKWDTMTTALCWTLYGSIGFVLATASWCFLSVPWETKYSNSMAFIVSMTLEEAEEKEDDVTGLWCNYLLALFVWPLYFVMIDIGALFLIITNISKVIALGIRKVFGCED